MGSLIYQDSPTCVKSELDLFTLPPTQAAIEKGQYVEYHPLANIQGGGPLEFNISGSGEDYLDLSAYYLHIKANVLKSGGIVLPPNEAVVPVNLFLHSLFSQVDVSLNERIISSASNTYPHRGYIETLLNYGEDAKKSSLTCEGFFKDEEPAQIDPHAKDATVTAEDKQIPAVIVHPGLQKHYELIQQSKTVDMIGQLHCDIFHQNRLMLNLVDVKIKMIRSKPELCLLSTDAQANYKVVLEHASLFVRKVKVSPGVSLGHAKALEKTSAKYPIDRVICKTYSVPAGSWAFLQDNVFLGVLPKRLIVTCVENAAMNGQYGKNPFLFAHHDVNFISIYVDGQPLPCKPLELNFDTHNYIRGYHSLFSGFHQDKGIYISREDYAKGHVLYAFDLTPDLCDGDHFKLQHQGNLRVEIKFSQALADTLSIIIYAEFQNVIEISKSRHVLCDFAN